MKDKVALQSLEQSRDERELSTLMKQGQAGDSESYHQLLTRIQKMLTRYVENSTAKLGISSASGTEDILQDILLAVHTKRHTYDPKHFFLPWLYAIARYKIIDFFRRNKRSFSLVSLEDELENIEAMQPLEQVAPQDLESLLKDLPEKQREVLKLVKLDELSIAEASKKTGYSPSDIKVTVHRAIKALKEHS